MLKSGSNCIIWNYVQYPNWTHRIFQIFIAVNQCEAEYIVKESEGKASNESWALNKIEKTKQKTVDW